MPDIKVAIIGVGNCASSLIQGVQKYADAAPDQTIPGLMHPVLGEYGIGDIQFVAAFDVDADKVGKDLSEAIFSGPNNTVKFQDVPNLDVEVQRGMTHDGVNYLPVGSEEATKWYVEQVLQAGCGFINCIPVFIASGENDYWQNRFREAGAPIIGDDIKSQVGATITHRVLTRLFMDRGVELQRTYQLNFGGNTDFMNMLDRDRLDSKKISKTQSVTSQVDEFIPDRDVHVGPSDYVPWLTDRKWCYIRMEGKTFGDVPLNLELKLEVWDSPNSAGVVIDAVRCAKIAKDRGISGPITAPSSYFMKSPLIQYTDDEARQLVEDFISGEESAQG